MHAPTLSKRQLQLVRGIPMTVENQPFVAVPLTILKELLRRPAPDVGAEGIPAGSVDARSFARSALAATLKRARNAASMTQADLAKKMRISQARVSQVEHGLEPVSVAFVKRWLKGCGLPEDWNG